MTTDLHDALHARADRAPQTPDLDDVLSDVRVRADRLGRRRRNLIAAGGGSLAVVALTAGVLAVAPGGADRSGPGNPAGGPPSNRSSATVPAAAHALEQRRLAKAKARQQAARPGLVTIAPAPRSAEVSITLVPRGWVLLSHQGPNTLYGPPAQRGTSPDSFVGKLLVSVHERIDANGSYPLTVAGRPASYQAGDGNDYFQGVDVIVDATTEVNFQIPPSARLTRAEALRLANTLDIRSTAEKSHG